MPIEEVIAAAASLDDARAWVRLSMSHATPEDDAILSRALVTATGQCEAMLGKALVARAVRETLTPTGDWQRLARGPVVAITAVDQIDAAGNRTALPITDYAMDIDADGTGLIRITAAADTVQVGYVAGQSASADDVPPAIAQGIIELAAQIYHRRDQDMGTGGARGAADALPPSVAALWQPWRTVRL